MTFEKYQGLFTDKCADTLTRQPISVDGYRRTAIPSTGGTGAETAMSNDNIIYVDTDGRTLDNVVKLDTTYWTEEDFCALDGLTNEQTWEFAWADTGCTTPSQFAAKISGKPLNTYKVYHSRIVTDVYEVQAEDEDEAELAWSSDPQAYKIVSTDTENDLVEVAL